MAQKDLLLRFGSGDPRTFSGLTPTFLIFSNFSGIAVTAPTLAEVPTSTGFYKFTFGYTVGPICFLADGGAGLNDSDRYVSGTLDPIQVVDQRVGFETDSIGSTSVAPTTIFGHALRNYNFNEGDSNYNKASGAWTIYSIGSSTILRVKTLADNTTQTTKT